jgi:hypothetical protein
MKQTILVLALSGLVALTTQAVEIKAPELALAKVRRIYVEQIGPTSDAVELHDMIIAALQNSGLFLITENPEHGDVILKGSGDEKVFNEQHNTSDSIGIHAGDSSGTRAQTSFGTATSSNRSMSAGVTSSESSHIQERRHEARASVRLVTPEGDVIWSTTQESAGGKFRGAMADVADKIAGKLIEETKRVRTLAAAASTLPPPNSDHSPEKSSSCNPASASGLCP